MLLEFSATNFKSIKNTQTLSLVGSSLKGPHEPLDVDFPGDSYGILPCAIIYGANASGKSNLLEAFRTMRRMVFSSHSQPKKNKGLTQEVFLLDEEWATMPTSFDISFIAQGVRYDFGFSFDSDSILEEWLYSYPEGRRRKLYERVGMEIQFGSGMRGAKKQLVKFLKKTSLFFSTATQNNHEELNIIAEFFSKIFMSNRISVASHVLNISFKENEIDERTIKFLNLIGTGVDSYRQVVSDDVPDEAKAMVAEMVTLFNKHGSSDVEIEMPDNFDKNMEIELCHKNAAGSDIYFGVDLESAGTRRLLVLLNSVFKVIDEGDIAIIDELDASLHTHAVEAIIQLFLDPEINKNNAQIIATTHDTNLLNPMKLRRDEIWFAEKGINGASEYFSLAEINGRKEEIFEKSYLQGRYGAVPPSFDTSNIKVGLDQPKEIKA